MRSAEKKRSKTCDFANKIADIVISQYRNQCPEFIHYEQTVIAGVVIQTPAKLLYVVGLGVGTKSLSASKILQYQIQSCETKNYVIDLHAEVLARRSFLKFIYQFLMLNHTIIYDHSETHPNIAKPIQTKGVFSEPIFILKQPTGRRLKLNTGYSIHFYTSSQPCGNASVKKWISSKKPRYYDLPSDTYPTELHHHQKLHLTAVKEGQIAVLVKNNNKNDDSYNTTGLNKQNDCIPAGVSYVKDDIGCIMSCSDKICKWNSLGLQGSLLSNILEPLYLSTITVGRKFSQSHCERALCCRASHFCYPAIGPPSVTTANQSNQSRSSPLDTDRCLSPVVTAAVAVDEDGGGGIKDSCDDALKLKKTEVESQYFTHHPAMLCCDTKFDEGCIITSTIPANTLALAATQTLTDDLTDDADNANDDANDNARTARPLPSESRHQLSSASCVSKLSHANTTQVFLSNAPSMTTTTTMTMHTQESLRSIGAQFSESRCLAWWPDYDYISTPTATTTATASESATVVHTADAHCCCEVIDSNTGFLSQQQSQQERHQEERDEVADDDHTLSQISSDKLLSCFISLSKSLLKYSKNDVETDAEAKAVDGTVDCHTKVVVVECSSSKSSSYKTTKSMFSCPRYVEAKKHLLSVFPLNDWIDKEAFFNTLRKQINERTNERMKEL